MSVVCIVAIRCKSGVQCVRRNQIEMWDRHFDWYNFRFPKFTQTARRGWAFDCRTPNPELSPYSPNPQNWGSPTSQPLQITTKRWQMEQTVALRGIGKSGLWIRVNLSPLTLY